MFEIANPCRGVCEVNNKGYCKGCLRKREERFHWNDFTPFQKQMIVNLCGRRRIKAIAARKQAEWNALHGTAAEQEVVIPQLDMFVINDSQADISSATDAASQSLAEENHTPRNTTAEDNKTAPLISEPADQANITSVFPDEGTSDDASNVESSPVLTSPPPAKTEKHKKAIKKKPEIQKDSGQFDLF